ncbi:MAG TPA: hypothetical protein VFM21_08195 [Terriglobia bacterium]|nr:hypothetical protein [Terriglobia bacterium]
MFLASLILILSTAMLLFYFQTACQRILRRKFDRDYSRSIVHANRLEFPAVQRSIVEFGNPVDYSRLRMTLRCDFLALTYLLKNAGNIRQRLTRDERLLIIYSRSLFFSLFLRHLLRLGESPAILKLTAVLEYFANVVGQRVDRVRVGNLTPSDYLLSL